MADAYARMSGRLARADRAPGLRADQRDDRHHRGGQEPHAAARARRRHRGGRRPVQLPHRPGRAGHARSARCAERVHSPASAAADVVRAVPRRPSSSGARWCSTCRSTCRPPPAPRPAGAAAGARCRRRSGRPPARSRALAALLDGAPSARCSSPAAARAARRPRAARRWPSASGALLATSAVANGLFARQPVVARHLRRVRLAAGRRADPRRRPGRRLGLRAEHVDDAARHADRPGRARWCRSTSTRTRSARTGRSTSAWSATSAATAADVARRAGRAAAPATAPTASRAAIAAAGALARRAVRRPSTGAGRHRPADAVDRRWTTCCPRERIVAVDSGNFMGYPSAYLSVPGRGRVLLHPGVPVDRAGAGHRDRRGAGPAGPAAGRRARRRRGADGRRRAGDRGAARAADGRGGLRRPRLRRRGAPLRPDADHATVTLPRDRPRRDRPRATGSRR